jgi:threonine/homoserine/homoserine lactone efflux protein
MFVMVPAALAGLGLGFLVAAQVGPIWLLCARTALRSGLAPALAMGVGVAVVDFLYACLGVAGAAGVLRLTGLRVALGLLGAVVLVVLGARTLLAAFRMRSGSETDEEVSSPRAALRTAAIATASNPLTVASWGAIFAATSTARFTSETADTLALLAGVLVGSLALYTLLAFGMRALGRRMSDRALRLADGAAGLGMIGYGGLLGLRTLHGSS